MKKLIILLAFFAFASAVFAQPGNDKYLEADLNRLNRRFESIESIIRLPEDKNKAIRLERAKESAENELGRFKEKHPGYDVSKFEKDLANYKNPGAFASGANDDASDKSSGEVSDYAKVENLIETIDEILELRPDTSRFLQNDEKIVDDTKQQLKDFRTKFDNLVNAEFIALANDKSNRKLLRTAEKAERGATGFQRYLDAMDVKEILEETDPNKMLSNYFNVLFYQEKLNRLSKIYSDNSKVLVVNKIADKMIAELGTLDQIKSKGKANYAAMVAKRRMYPEIQNDPALRNLFIRAFESSVFRNGDISENAAVLKVHLVSSGWSVKRNELTGVILSRDQQAELAYKATNGKCYTYMMIVEQKHQAGGKYSGGANRSGSTNEILCENVPK